jgi:hypothetical protein
MLLAAHAYAMRQAARRALRAGNPLAAVSLGRTALSLHTTPEGTAVAAVSTSANLAAESERV